MADEPPVIHASDLVARMEEAGGDVLTAIGELLAELTRRDLPIGDPEADPNPAYALAEHVEVRRYGNFVSVSVEGPYAAKQHENLDFQHPRGGRAKFLERNAVAIISAFEGDLAATVKRTFSGRDLRRRSFETRH